MAAGAYRLPRKVVPAHYRIELDASPERDDFTGAVAIELRVLQQTREVELHARKLQVADVELKAGKVKVQGEAQYHPERETVSLLFPKALPKGKALLSIRFSGQLDPRMNGLYRAQDGATKALVSQCEATEARGIFPCFDEPDLKATLQWTVTAPKGLAVIANGAPLKRSVSAKKGTQTVAFAKTPVLPTYLAALTIGPFKAGKASKVAGTPCRAWAAPEKLSQAAFSEEVTRVVLPWFEKYFGQKYHYGKLDQVAVPGFDAGAMENAGAIFYRQNLFLMDQASASARAKQAIAETVAHEIAHQWFGNRVTLKWWDDLWLNEAFATWVSNKAVDQWKPEWRMWDEYQVGKSAALTADALENTHPIYSEVTDPAQALEMFDVITYKKGGAVLRMLESHLGQEPFQRGLKRYMAAFKDGNARGGDLWKKLGEASRQPVTQLMESWIKQAGFPVIDLSASREGGRSVLTLRQKRFFSGAAAARTPTDQVWSVPLVVRYQVGDEVRAERMIFNAREGRMVLGGSGELRWVYANAGSVGFYRLNPDEALLRQLLDGGIARLTPAERIGLIEDQWALMRNGSSNLTRFLEVLGALAGEKDYMAFEALSSRLGYLEDKVVPESERAALRQAVGAMFGSRLAEYGWEKRPGEPDSDSRMRALAIGLLGSVARLPEVLSGAEQRQLAELRDPKAVEPNLAGTLVQLAAYRGDSSRFDAYWKAYGDRKANQLPPQEQLRYLHSLASFDDPALARRTMDSCLKGEVPQEQLAIVLGQLLASRLHQREAWAFLKENWSGLGAKVGAMGISRLVGATGALPYDLKGDLEAFFMEHPVPEAKRALAQAVESIEQLQELKRREVGALSAWLRSRPQARAG